MRHYSKFVRSPVVQSSHRRVTAHLHSIRSPGPKSTDQFLPTHTADVHLFVECVQNTEERTWSCVCTDYPLKKCLRGNSPQRKTHKRRPVMSSSVFDYVNLENQLMRSPVYTRARVHSIHTLPTSVKHVVLSRACKKKKKKKHSVGLRCYSIQNICSLWTTWNNGDTRQGALALVPIVSPLQSQQLRDGGTTELLSHRSRPASVLHTCIHVCL